MPFATLAEIVRHQAATQPGRIALTFADRDTSYGALDRRASQVANGLIAAGLSHAEPCGTSRQESRRFFEIWFGAAKANAVLVPVNWRLARPEIAFVVNDAGAKILFVGAEFLDTVAAIRDQLTSVRKRPRRRSTATGSTPAMPATSMSPGFSTFTTGSRT